MRCRSFADRADWPVGSDPFTRSVCQHRGQIHRSSGLVDRGRLYSGDLVLAQGLAHDLEPARQRRISERLLGLAFVSDCGNEGLFWVDELRLSLAKSTSQSCYGVTRPVADQPPP